MLVKAFRLFVSSTFVDFAQEREILQGTVFPALDAYCAAKGYQFLALDMRWGINEEAHLDQRTADICLGEVHAAKGYPAPNFLIMIGNRYGWVPLPFAIAHDEFEAVVAWLEGQNQQQAALALRTLYQLDDNHLVSRSLSPVEPDGGLLISAYTLRSREDEVPELKPAEVWARLEAQLRGALQGAADQLLRLGQIDAAAHEKYFLSVTEQEIIHGLPSYSERHSAGEKTLEAIAFIREIAGSASGTPGLIRRTIAFLRSRVGSSSVRRERFPSGIEYARRLEELKSGIRRALPNDSIITARAVIDEGGKLDAAYLAHFTSAVKRKLEAAIDRHIAQVSAIELTPDFALQSERDEHQAFAELKRKIFAGRENNLSTIVSYIAGADDHPLILYGPSGGGKSALMARAIGDAEDVSDVPVIYRFIGASAASSDFRSLFVSLVEDLAAHGMAQKPDEFEQDANKFTAQIKAILSSLAKPVVIFIDALDQLRKPYRTGWLPERLPTTVKLVLSVLDDKAYKTDSGIHLNLRKRFAPEAFVEIEPLEPMHGREILTALEKEAQRQLGRGQRNYIIGQFEKAGASPLYLRTAFEIARTWRSTVTAGKEPHVLAETTPAIIAQLIGNLADVHHHERVLVTRTLGYLAAAREGLSVKELTEVLARDQGVMQAISSEKHGARTAKLPPSVWVRLNRQLAPFLIEKRIDEQPLLQFFHRQVAHVAREQHYEPAKAALHGALAEYFDCRVTRPDREDIKSANAGISIYDKRSLSELPYQLHSAQNTFRLDQILMSPGWMQQKLVALGPQALVADYEQFGRGQIQGLIGRTLRLITAICTRDPRQLLPQLIGRLITCTEPSATDFLLRARHLIDKPAMLTRLPSLTPPGIETARLEGHTGEVRAIVALPDGRLASGSADNTIRLWDVATGEETARLAGHTGEIRAMVVMPDGRLASGSADTTIRLWDAATDSETAQFAGHGGPVIALTVLIDGRLASGSDDRTIRLWDVATGAETDCLLGHGDSVNALAALADGRLASGSSDRTIRLWNVKAGVETARLERGAGEVMELALGGVPISGILALAIRADCRLISGWDYLIRQWDVERGTETASPLTHQDVVRTLAVLPDGRLASGSEDRTIRIWDPDTGAETARLSGHGSSVNGLAVLADGRLASGSSDHTIRLWDVIAAGESAQVAADGDAVNALTLLPGGRIASGSGSRWGGKIRLWDVNSGAEVAQFNASGSGLNALELLPDGHLASCSDGRITELWDLKSGASNGNLQYHDDGIKALVMLPDGRLASGSRDCTIRLWDLKTRAETARFAGHRSPFLALAMLADGRLASGSEDGIIRLWDLRTGTETGFLDVQGSSIIALKALSDGRLASGSDDGTIRIWDVKAGAETKQLTGHRRSITALAVLADGRLASGSDDRTIRLWDVKCGTETTRLEVDASVSSVIALPGARIVAGDRLGRLHWLEIED